MSNPLTEPKQSAHNSDGSVFENAAAQARANGLDQIAAAFDSLGGDDKEPAESESTAHESE